MEVQPNSMDADITLNSASLDFQGSSPTFDNSSTLSVKNSGELILQSGVTISNSSLDFASSTFKPSGAVSLSDNGSSHVLTQTSSVILEGDTISISERNCLPGQVLI